jgi:hydroxymethylglutaryl-CoA synthase
LKIKLTYLDLKTSHSEHIFDFYKPIPSSEYPLVDGLFSIQSYLRSLDETYLKYKQKFKAKVWLQSRSKPFQRGKEISLSSLDYAVFHTPYSKLVQKAVGRMVDINFTYTV